MWTYLVILTSFCLLLVVFGRRLFLFYRKPIAPKETPAVETAEDAEEIERKKISQIEKQRVQELCERGEVLLNTGQDEEAIKCFVQALAIDEHHLDTIQKLAKLYLQKQMFAAASALFKQLAEQTEDSVQYSHLGLSLYQLGDFEGAKNAYQTAVSIDDSRPQRFVSLAQVYRALGQAHNALIAINKAIELEKENRDYYLLLIEAHMEMGGYADAIYHIKKLLEQNEDDKDLMNMLKEAESLKTEKGSNENA